MTDFGAFISPAGTATIAAGLLPSTSIPLIACGSSLNISTHFSNWARLARLIIPEWGLRGAIRVNGQVWLYYTGLFLRREVRHSVAIGLAVSDDGLNFRRAFDGPVLGTGPLDPFMTATPCVIREPSGFRMCYGSGSAWLQSSPAVQPEPTYGIRQVHSSDGRIWSPETVSVIEPAKPNYVGLMRPLGLPVARRSASLVQPQGERVSRGRRDTLSPCSGPPRCRYRAALCRTRAAGI